MCVRWRQLINCMVECRFVKFEGGTANLHLSSRNWIDLKWSFSESQKNAYDLAGGNASIIIVAWLKGRDHQLEVSSEILAMVENIDSLLHYNFHQTNLLYSNCTEQWIRWKKQGGLDPIWTPHLGRMYITHPRGPLVISLAILAMSSARVITPQPLTTGTRESSPAPHSDEKRPKLNHCYVYCVINHSKIYPVCVRKFPIILSGESSLTNETLGDAWAIQMINTILEVLIASYERFQGKWNILGTFSHISNFDLSCSKNALSGSHDL